MKKNLTCSPGGWGGQGVDRLDLVRMAAEAQRKKCGGKP
jgi:hypothetical protein